MQHWKFFLLGSSSLILQISTWNKRDFFLFKSSGTSVDKNTFDISLESALLMSYHKRYLA